MALKLSTDLKNYIISKTIEALAGTCGTAGTASLNLYSGTQPADADQGTAGTLIVTISNIAWGNAFGCTAGTAALASTAAYSGTSSSGGTIGWGRMTVVKTGYSGSAATFTIDGNVGTASSNVFVINNVVASVGGIVSLLTSPISLS